MGGLDDIIDEADHEADEEEARSLMDELGIESREELEKLEDRLERVQQGLIHYDKRMEEIEQQLSILEGVIIAVIKDEYGDEELDQEMKDDWEADDTDNDELEWT